VALLQIRGVSKTFRTLRALDGVDIDVEVGERPRVTCRGHHPVTATSELRCRCAADPL